MIAFLVLFLINVYMLATTREPREFIEIKEKYTILRKHLTDTEHKKFHMLKRPVPITGMKMMTGSVGYNTNKGEEIVVCLNGSTNDIFHVLIHELAHCTVDEYSHSDQYWENYIELRDLCVNIGIYEKIPEKKKFCGQHIQDK